MKDLDTLYKGTNKTAAYLVGGQLIYLSDILQRAFTKQRVLGCVKTTLGLYGIIYVDDDENDQTFMS